VVTPQGAYAIPVTVFSVTQSLIYALSSVTQSLIYALQGYSGIHLGCAETCSLQLLGIFAYRFIAALGCCFILVFRGYHTHVTRQTRQVVD
jgi:hypothetical protein